MDDIPLPLDKEKSPFLRKVREVIRSRGLAYKTEKTYLLWIRRYIYFNHERHPNDLGEKEVSDYLSYLCPLTGVTHSRSDSCHGDQQRIVQSRIGLIALLPDGA